jgi:hypothetical protein
MNEPQQDDRIRATKPLDFSTFLISLGTSAMIQLGDAPDPTSGGMLKPDPEGARQTIDLLGLLEEKTRGNLDPTEAELLANLLSDLRLRARQLNTGN